MILNIFEEKTEELNLSKVANDFQSVFRPFLVLFPYMNIFHKTEV